MIKQLIYNFYQRVVVFFIGNVPIALRHKEKSEPILEKEKHGNKQEIKRYWR